MDHKGQVMTDSKTHHSPFILLPSKRAPVARGALVLAALLVVLGAALPAQAADPALPEISEVPEDLNVNINFNTGTGEAQTGLSEPMKIVLLLSVLTLVPSILLTMTSFTRIIIVLSFVRRSLSVQEMPPNQIIVGLSLFLTVYVMSPVLTKINEVSIQPGMRGEITLTEALKRAEDPLRGFMLKQTRKKDIALFARVAQLPGPLTRKTVPFHILLPAFALSEIKTAFQMGFIVFLPMLVLDMIVATLLVSMGMFMLPPVMVSVPLKLLLFVLVDGWHLVIGSLAQSFM